MNTVKHSHPWQHWTACDFLTAECLAELKAIDHCRPQQIHGKRLGDQRLFIGDHNANLYPELYQLWQALHSSSMHDYFGSHTGIDYSQLFPRLEVISDIGDFYLEPHCDHWEKRLTALVYTDHAKLWPATVLGQDHRIAVADNLCMFFVPGPHTIHHYPAMHFDQVRRALQINYWTYSAATELHDQTMILR